MRHLFLVFLLAPVLFANAQDKNVATTYAATITPQGLKQHLQVLADPNMEGRETATAGERRAAQYIKAQFEKMGLKPGTANGYEMPFTVYSDSLKEAALTVNGTSYILDNDFGTYVDYNHTMSGRFSEVVFAGYGISTKQYDDYKNLDVAGKLVVVYEGEPVKDGVYLATGTKSKSEWAGTSNKVLAATHYGAAGLIIIQRKFPRKYKQFRSGDVYIDGHKTTLAVNTWFISEKVAADIFKDRYAEIAKGASAEELPRISRVEARVFVSSVYQQYAINSANIMGVLEGSDKKDEYVFVTAHYDHLGKMDDDVFCGADDNASGTSGVLKIAEAFVNAKKAGKGPRRSMIFMLVSGEEKGLWGSDHYTQHPVFPFEKTSVDLNIDMIGRTGYDYVGTKDSVNYIYVIGDDKLSTDLRPINERNNKLTKLKLDYKYNDPNDPNRFYYRSDHYNFAKNGVPVIFYFDGENKDYHKPADTMEKINFELMARRAKLVFYTAWEMAGMDNMLKRDIPLR